MGTTLDVTLIYNNKIYIGHIETVGFIELEIKLCVNLQKTIAMCNNY